MAEDMNTFTYVSDSKLEYYTRKLKTYFPKATDFIDDTTAALDKMYSSQKIEKLVSDKFDSIIDDDVVAATDKTWSAKKIFQTFSKITGVEFQKVEVLPEASEGKVGVIYLLPNEGEGNNIYDEYIWIASTDSNLTYKGVISTEDGSIDIDSDVISTKLTAPGVYTFAYDGEKWIDDNGEVANLNELGITVNDPSGKLATADEIIINADASGTFEKIGTTEISLEGYVREEQLLEITEEQIDTIFTKVWPEETQTPSEEETEENS